MVSELKDQNGLLKKDKDDLNRLIQEQSQQMTGVLVDPLVSSCPPDVPPLTSSHLLCVPSEKMARAIAQETQQLEVDLNEERSRYQNLLTEHLRLEEKYDDLKEEMTSLVSIRPALGSQPDLSESRVGAAGLFHQGWLLR